LIVHDTVLALLVVLSSTSFASLGSLLVEMMELLLDAVVTSLLDVIEFVLKDDTRDVVAVEWMELLFSVV
jgi:hypothetical protein